MSIGPKIVAHRASVSQHLNSRTGQHIVFLNPRPIQQDIVTACTCILLDFDMETVLAVLSFRMPDFNSADARDGILLLVVMGHNRLHFRL
jgi:hypothetical protein